MVACAFSANATTLVGLEGTVAVGSGVGVGVAVGSGVGVGVAVGSGVGTGTGVGVNPTIGGPTVAVGTGAEWSRDISACIVALAAPPNRLVMVIWTGVYFPDAA